MHLFSRDPEVVQSGISYLVRVAPFYAFFGLGMALYFASQGAGKMLWPFAAGLVRLSVVSVAGWYWVSVQHGSLAGLYWIIAASQVLFGGINAVGMATGLNWGMGRWGRPAHSQAKGTIHPVHRHLESL